MTSHNELNDKPAGPLLQGDTESAAAEEGLEEIIPDGGGPLCSGSRDDSRGRLEADEGEEESVAGPGRLLHPDRPGPAGTSGSMSADRGLISRSRQSGTSMSTFGETPL